MYEKPRSTTLSIGVATKPYPNWRLPGKLHENQEEEWSLTAFCLSKGGIGILLAISAILGTSTLTTRFTANHMDRDFKKVMLSV
jgi:hypothetical protein